MTEYISSIKGLVKEYDNKKVLDISELHIEREKVTAIIGPSGAGKSTLLSILNGLLDATTGQMVFDGKLLGKKIDMETRRQMSMVFQKPVAFNTTVYENIAYSLKLRGMRSSEIVKQVEYVSELIGLKEKIRQKANTLSGGEAQRLTLARAMIFKPKMLLLDEPTANLDPANVAMIEKLILHTKTEYKTSIVIITHNMFQAKRISDNTIFLLNGNVVENGKTAQVFNSPQDARTQDFIEGRMIY